MSTQVKTESTETVKSKAEIEAEALVQDQTVVIDTPLQKLMAQVFGHELKVGGKWAAVIRHCQSKYPFEKTEKGEEQIHKDGFKIVLKSLMTMGKTYSSAQSIRSYIFKMARSENAEALEKLEKGEITVRASREAGRVRQSNPSKSNEAKFNEALNNAVRYAVLLNLSEREFEVRAERVYGEYILKKEAEKQTQQPTK
jgi:hypothetical protein